MTAEQLAAHRWISDRPGRWFAWEEFLVTRHRSKQSLPDAAGQRSLVTLCGEVLDPLREALGRPVHVTSGWRSDAVNLAVGGALHSRHKAGKAADIKVRRMSARALVRRIVALGLGFDKLIAYDTPLGGHVHVSWVSEATNRGLVYWCTRGASGRKVYQRWRP